MVKKIKKDSEKLKFTGERLIPEYTKDELVFYEHFSRYIFASQFVKGKKVLDIACGTGYGSEYLTQKGPLNVIGVDIDSKTIEYAKDKYKNKNIEFMVGDAQAIPLTDKSIDVLVSFETIEHLKEYKKFLSESKRVLSNEGLLVISTPNTEVFGGNEFHTKEFTIKEFKEELLKYYKNVELVYQNNLLISSISKKSLLNQDESREEYRIPTFKMGKKDPEESIYVIAVCSNGLIPEYNENILIDSGKELKKLYGMIQSQGEVIVQKESAFKEMKANVEQKQKELEQKQKELNEKNKELEKIKKSTSWKVTKPMRKTKTTANKAARLGKKSKSVIQTEGFNTFLRKAARYSLNRFSAKLSGGGVNFSQNYSDVKKEYEKRKRRVTVVIPSYNDFKVLKKCLESINKTVDADWVNLIIVDDASTDKNHVEYLKSIRQNNVKVVYQKNNGGFAKTVNAGFKAVKSGDVIVLNSDIEAKEYWLESLQVAAYSDEKIGIVGPKLLYPNGTIQYGGSHRNTEAPEWFDHYYRFKPSNFPQANIPNYVIGITGACMYVKRSVIKKIGFLDEKFPMAFEDMDYCIRAWNEGFRSLYFPMATLVHHESITRGTSQGAREKESLRYFWEKWGDWFDKRNVRNSKGITKIIYVLQATGVGGGHRMVFEHVNRLKKLGYDIELWALEGQPEWFPLEVQVKKFKDYKQLISSLEKEEAIKVATWWETAEPVWLASVNKGIPAFYLQDIESSYYKDDKYMQNFVLSKYKKEFTYLTICNWNKTQLAELGLSATVVACGIDSKTFKPVKTKREENVIIAIGRSHYLKNLPMTMNAWKKIKNNQPALWMFGIEPQLTDGLKNAEYFFKPSDQGVNELYNKATVLIQTSIHEGFCLPILEAMAAGALVVCTDAHGNSDFCVDGKNCLMVDQNDVEGLKKAIVRIFKDKNLQERLREEGYKKAREYDWPVIMKRIEGVYKELAVSSKKKHR